LALELWVFFVRFLAQRGAESGIIRAGYESEGMRRRWTKEGGCGTPKNSAAASTTHHQPTNSPNVMVSTYLSILVRPPRTGTYECWQKRGMRQGPGNLPCSVRAHGSEKLARPIRNVYERWSI